MIEIQFGKSTSKNYSHAIRLLKKLKNSQLIENGSYMNIAVLNDDELIANFRVIEELHQLIHGWTTTKMFFNEVEIQPWRFFNQMREIVDCNDSYNNTIHKENYCKIDSSHEGWGCKYLTETVRHLKTDSYYSYNEKYWYKFGQFTSDNVWQIDKTKIKDRLDKEIKGKGINACPHFNKENFEKTINELPDEIDLSSEFWDIIYEEDFIGSTIQQKPVSIEHITKEPKHQRTGRSFGISLFDDDKESEIEQEQKNHINRNIPLISFNDIGGIDEIIEIVREVIELPLIKPELFKHLGIKPHKGILLFGEPGNGKTMIAKAIANEINAHFIPISGPELLSKWHGESEERLRQKFIEARDSQPSIIFFDEIDSVAQKRTDSESGRIDSKFVNQLLTLMDGMETYGNVSVLASTNRPELLDEALLRPGRFDYKIEIKKPTTIGCRKILKILTKEMPLSNDVNIDEMAKELFGLSGAEIAFTVNEAAYNCMRRSINLNALISLKSEEQVDLNKLLINKNDFKEALRKAKK